MLGFLEWQMFLNCMLNDIGMMWRWSLARADGGRERRGTPCRWLWLWDGDTVAPLHSTMSAAPRWHCQPYFNEIYTGMSHDMMENLDSLKSIQKLPEISHQPKILCVRAAGLEPDKALFIAGVSFLCDVLLWLCLIFMSFICFATDLKRTNVNNVFYSHWWCQEQTVKYIFIPESHEIIV